MHWLQMNLWGIVSPHVVQQITKRVPQCSNKPVINMHMVAMTLEYTVLGLDAQTVSNLKQCFSTGWRFWGLNRVSPAVVRRYVQCTECKGHSDC